MSDIQDLADEISGRGMEITLQKDTRFFRKVGLNSRAVYSYGTLRRGETIWVGNREEYVEFEFAHKMQKFIPWLDDPASRPEKETEVSYMRLEDLP